MINGLFGKKKTHPFIDEVLMPGGGIGGGLPDYMGGAPKGQGSISPKAMQSAPKQKTNIGNIIAGTIGDYLVRRDGGQALFAQQQQLKAFLQAQQQRDQAKRFAGLQDWKYKQDYERENPSRTATMKDVEWLGGMSPEDRANALEVMRAKNPTFYTDWTGQRRANPAPISRSDWDNAKPIEGGQTPASGNFR